LAGNQPTHRPRAHLSDQAVLQQDLADLQQEILDGGRLGAFCREVMALRVICRMPMPAASFTVAPVEPAPLIDEHQADGVVLDVPIDLHPKV